jgi:hypothetical protein
MICGIGVAWTALVPPRPIEVIEMDHERITRAMAFGIIRLPPRRTSSLDLHVTEDVVAHIRSELSLPPGLSLDHPDLAVRTTYEEGIQYEFSTPFKGDPTKIGKALRAVNPSLILDTSPAVMLSRDDGGSSVAVHIQLVKESSGYQQCSIELYYPRRRP